MKKYDEYKDSGVAWIGEVPKHWEVKKMNYHCSTITDFVASGSFADLKRNVQYLEEPDYAMLIRTVDLSSNDKKQPPVYISKSSYEFLSNSNLVGGEIILPNIGAVGNVYIVPKLYKHMSLAPNAIMVKSYGKDKYLYYYFKSKPGVDSLTLIGKSTVQDKFNKTELRSLRVLVPPVTEQVAIAAYLDTHCAKIDNLISIQQKRIALLQELKQSVITHAVTKGLNPNVEMKQSAVEWIGDVPKHWEVRKIKQCCNKEQYSIKTGPFGSQLKGEELMSQGDVSVYSQQNVINNDFNKIRYFVSNKKAKSLSSFYTRANDVLITSRGTIGKAAILQPLYPKGILHPCLIAIRLDQEVCLPEWLTMYINETDCFKTDISVNSNATTIDVIYTGTLKDIYIPIPPISEQAAIASYLDHKCATIDTSISNAQHQIELLQEYKQSLITEVVTGKRKVTDN